MRVKLQNVKISISHDCITLVSMPIYSFSESAANVLGFRSLSTIKTSITVADWQMELLNKIIFLRVFGRQVHLPTEIYLLVIEAHFLFKC